MCIAVTIHTFTGYDIQTVGLEIQNIGLCFLLLEIIMIIGQCTDMIDEREAVLYEHSYCMLSLRKKKKKKSTNLLWEALQTV